MTKIIFQKQKYDCAIASGAMILGSSYAPIKRHIHTIKKRQGLVYDRGTYVATFCDFLRELGRQFQETGHNLSVSAFAKAHPHQTGLLVVRTGGRVCSLHALALVNGVVYDPAPCRAGAVEHRATVEWFVELL